MNTSIGTDILNLIFSELDVCTFFGVKYFFQEGIDIFCFDGLEFGFGLFRLQWDDWFGWLLRELVHSWVFLLNKLRLRMLIDL